MYIIALNRYMNFNRRSTQWGQDTHISSKGLNKESPCSDWEPKSISFISIKLFLSYVLNVRTCGNEINEQTKTHGCTKKLRLNFMTLEKHFVTNLTCLRDWGCGVFFNKQMQMLREKCLVFWHCSLLTKLQMFSISKQCWNVWIFFS